MKRAIAIAGAAILVAAIVVFGSASVLSHPVQRRIGDTPADLRARNVQFHSDSGSMIHGWLCAVPNATAAVVLLPGIRANRLAMVDRARFLRRAGYSVLLIDFQATGESIGDHITFGWLESRDVLSTQRLRPQRETGCGDISDLWDRSPHRCCWSS